MKTYSIGRDLECDIVINDNTDVISRRHAILNVSSSGKMTILDQSSNGTYVNGIRISSNVPVPVTRKDSVSFAHVAKLDWNLIPRFNTWIKYLLIVLAAAAIIVASYFAYTYCTKETPPPPPIDDTSSTQDTTKTIPVTEEVKKDTVETDEPRDEKVVEPDKEKPKKKDKDTSEKKPKEEKGTEKDTTGVAKRDIG